jgi:hypothetical protein
MRVDNSSNAAAKRCVDYHVTQVVDGTKGIHGMIPKAISRDNSQPQNGQGARPHHTGDAAGHRRQGD